MPEVRINLLHALENYLNMYKASHEEVLVIESISNALDAKAKNINITIEKSYKGYFYIIEDDGFGMSKNEFENYHTIALSSKKKGESIGFAGVGAKIYLAAWPGAEIYTHTFNGKEAYASRMYRYGNSIHYDYIRPDIKKRGTKYIVKLADDHFIRLDSGIEEYIRYWFNEAINTMGITIYVNGKRIQPFSPNIQEEYRTDIYHFFISKDDLPREGLELTVFGKLIRLEPIEWIYEVKEEYRNKIGGIIYLNKYAKYLSTSKEDFRDNKVASVIKRCKKELYIWLKNKGFLKDTYKIKNEYLSMSFTYEISNKLTYLLNTEKWKWLNPLLEVRKPVLVPNINGDKEIGLPDVSQSEGDKSSLPNNNENHVTDKVRGFTEMRGSGYKGQEIKRTSRGGIRIELTEEPDRQDEGWISPEQNAICYNIGHNLHKKILATNDSLLINYNILRVIVMVLIRNKLNEIDTKKALDIITEFLTESF